MPNCKRCGAPLTKGNIEVVRPRGKKRPYRVCRRCPDQARSEVVQPTGREVMLNDPEGNPNVISREHIIADTAGGGLQRPQDSTGGPVTVEAVFDYPPPPRYRYFMTRDQAERVKRALEKTMTGFGIGVEVIPVPEDQVEADPAAYDELIEVEVHWKNE